MRDYYVKNFYDFDYARNLDYIWDLYIELGICSEETLRVVTSINGYNAETMQDILYATIGLRSLEQLCDEYELTIETNPDLFDIDDED